MDATELEQQLQALEAAGDRHGLVQCLKQWEADPSLAETAVSSLTYWRGKLEVIAGDYPTAVEHLALAVRHQPGRAHAWYLLGTSLVRSRQWLDASQALQQALKLQPQLFAARVDLARAQLALGDAASALELLQPFADQLKTPAQFSLWAELLTHAHDNPEQLAAALPEGVFSQPKLANAIWQQWIHAAAGLHLAGQVDQARAWWTFLLEAAPSSSDAASRCPMRLALLALLLLELTAPSASQQQLSLWSAQLRSALWWPLSRRESDAWGGWLRELLLQTAAGLESRERATDDRDAEILRAVLDALPALEPPGANTFDICQRLDLLRQGLISKPERGSRTSLTLDQRLGFQLLRHQRDLKGLIGVLERLQQQNDRSLLRMRSLVESHLDHLSDLMLNRPLLLTDHPSPTHLQRALRMRSDALHCLKRCNRRLSAITPALPLHQRPRLRWLFLASTDLPQCFLYRVEQKQQQLTALGCETRVVLRDDLNDWSWSQQLLWADAVVVCRLPALQKVMRAIEASRRAGLPVYYDIDDLIIDPEFCPPALETYGGTLTAVQHRRFVLDVPLFADAMKACDAAIVSTPSLARRWRQLHPGQPVHVLANMAPPQLWRALRLPCSPPRVDDVTLVVASGTTAHKQVWIEELAPALDHLLTHRPQLQLHLLGHLQIPLVLQHHRARIRCHPFTDYATYLQHMAEADIGLVALEPGCFTDAKSAIRWMEFSFLGLAAVLSPSRTYTEILDEGVHARFARGVEQWVEQVERLLDDPSERRAMALRAQQHAQELFGPHQAKAFWSPLLMKAGPIRLFQSSQPSLPPTPRRQRLLVLNVFFAPQSVGGATRVAQDQVKALMDHLGDQWEVTVLCTDHQPWQTIEFSDRNRLDGASHPRPIWEEQWPWPVDVHDWHGARVVRMAIPPRSWSEHQDASVERFCRQWFPHQHFDLIHAHCLQVLSVAPLKVAAELDIPYLVTLHDGWWLSPNQFLTSSSGRSIDPGDPIGHHDTPVQVDPGQLERDRQRRQELDHVLARAAARVAVSASFADLHRQAGIADVMAIDNRWQPMQTAQSRQRRAPDLPLRCCFVGGVALHKGMAVLQAAVMRARPAEPGLIITVIDSTLNPGDAYQLHWGNTPVQFLPSVPMAEMAGFYAEQDVLLAPSTWPESYGLVTREALSAGLWVVASEIGALADPIRHGENGHRVPPRDAAALAAVLEQLAQEHPTPQPLIAFGDALPPLHEELNDLYTAVLKRG